MAIDNRQFEAKDLKRFLGLTPEKIFLWLRTYHIFEPAERARSVRGKNKYSRTDMVKLGLIAKLLSLGVPLVRIRSIFIELDKVYQGRNLWEIIISQRNLLKRQGLILIIARVSSASINAREAPDPAKEPDFEYVVDLATYSDAPGRFKEYMKFESPLIIVNIGLIVCLVEEIIEKQTGPQRKRNNAEYPGTESTQTKKRVTK